MANQKKRRSALSEMLYAPVRDMDARMNPLAKLVRTIFADLNIRPNRFYMMLNQYLNDPMNGFSTPKEKASERGNIQKELTKKQITFKTLVKLIRVLNARRAGLTLTLEWHDGQVTQHHINTNNMSSFEADIMNILTSVNEQPTPDVQKDKEDLQIMLEMLDSDTETNSRWENVRDDDDDDDFYEE